MGKMRQSENQPVNKRYNQNLERAAGEGRPDAGSFSAADGQFLEMLRQTAQVDFSSESKIRASLREGLVHRSSGRAGKQAGSRSGFRRGLLAARRAGLVGMSVALILLIGITVKNLGADSAGLTPGLTMTFLPEAISETIIPVTTGTVTQTMNSRPEQIRATPQAPVMATVPDVSAAPRPIASPAIITVSD